MKCQSLFSKQKKNIYIKISVAENSTQSNKPLNVFLSVLRWENYSNIGDVIPGTRLITFKVPLAEVNEKKRQKHIEG